MTHFVTDRCIRCKFTDCVEVCPVDCFYEGANMLVIDPEQCIDCGVCIPECPADAIVSDEFIVDVLSSSEEVLNAEQKVLKSFYDINMKYSKLWPNITAARPHSENAENYKEVVNKAQFFGENLVAETTGE
ncbi:ferredoxin 1 [Anaplasma platys]|uniref:Ferredoxin n=1 Tax=Anaplasma platys TaxID=949 RepID=A0A858PX51_9RICK|nr:ferredoxin family protein [Anaplasma platys]QJC27163.1 ferredoxin 1 [Anaplasma platys]